MSSTMKSASGATKIRRVLRHNVEGIRSRFYPALSLRLRLTWPPFRSQTSREYATTNRFARGDPMSNIVMRFGLRRQIVPLSLLLLALGAGTSLAQSNLGAITGIIADPQQAVVPEATVTATNVATGLRTSTKSNSAGVYLVTSLPLGSYIVAVEHPGFSTYVRQGITLDAGQRLGLDIALA